MTRLIQLLFALIGYVCTATVITLALGLFYLWRTDRLSDEKMFRLAALFHDVDLQQIADAQKSAAEAVPEEELSLAGMSRQQQLLDRNFEIKQLALQRGRQMYDISLQNLLLERERNERVAQEWENKLKQQQELTTQENIAQVVSQLEQVKAPQGKALLMRYIDEGSMEDAILLLNKMSESKRGKILKSFESDEELDKLHEIQKRMQAAGAETPPLDKPLDEAPANSRA
jgi:hypothetical protein